MNLVFICCETPPPPIIKTQIQFSYQGDGCVKILKRPTIDSPLAEEQKSRLGCGGTTVSWEIHYRQICST